MEPISLPSLSAGIENSSGRSELAADLQVLQDAINQLATEGNGGSVPLDGSNIRVLTSANVTVSSGGTGSITFDPDLATVNGDDLQLDLDPFININILTDGLYEFEAEVDWDVNATGTRRAYFQHDTSGHGPAMTVHGVPEAATALASNSVQWTRFVGVCFAGDSINLVVEQNSGGDLDVVYAEVTGRRSL